LEGKFMLSLRLSFIALAIGLWSSVAWAQASRTWVSGVGDDANPCSRTAPCKTFAGAISKTANGGEIDALDPAGYGAVTITKGITIDGGGGQVASVLVSGTNGIVVRAGPTNVVTLRNLRINGIAGAGAGGLNGIRYLAGGALHVENCHIFGFTGMESMSPPAPPLHCSRPILSSPIMATEFRLRRPAPMSGQCWFGCGHTAIPVSDSSSIPAPAWAPEPSLTIRARS